MNFDTKQIHINPYYVDNIPSQMRLLVWNNYFGSNKTFGKCVNCTNYITPNTFCCGLYISLKNGGMIQPGNLKPVCTRCYLLLKDKSIAEIQSNSQVNCIQSNSYIGTQPSIQLSGGINHIYNDDDLMDTTE